MKLSNLNVIIFGVLSLTVLLNLSACYSPEDTEEQTFRYKAQLKPFTSCNELTTYLKATAEQESKLIDYYNEVAVVKFPDRLGTVDVQVNDSLAVPTASFDDFTSVESSAAIADYSSTNNQVSGVEEADFVKTDAQYTYLVSGGHFLIFDNWPVSDSRELSRVNIEGTPSNLFISDDIVWIVSHIYDYKYQDYPDDALVSFAPRLNHLTSVSVFDVSDRENPELIRETTLEGYYVDARQVNDQVFMVTSAQIDISPFMQDDAEPEINSLLPVMTDKLHQSGEIVSTTAVVSECGNISRPETANGTGTISVLSFDLSNPQADIKRQSIISNSGTVYASQQHLYLATMEDHFWAWLPVVEADDETPTPGTTFHKFSLTDEPSYIASGRVDGHIINQFAMDEHDDLLRVVTTLSAWWTDDAPVNSLFILQQQGNQLVERSKLTDLGKKGERIYAARFMADKGFLVTFERIDPLYTLDLSDPDKPRVAGELEVPGFSTYLHPVDDDLLLAVGRSITNNSTDLSLFDISDFDHPSLLFRESIGDGSYSEAEYNHKAFTWFAQQQLLALPVSQWSRVSDIGDYPAYDMFNGLKLYKVIKETGFDHIGNIDHSNFYHDDANDNWFFPDNIRRSFFISDTESNSYLYSISSRGMKVNAVSDLETDLATFPLPVDDWNNYILYD